MIPLKAYILVETKKNLLLLAFSKSFSNGFSLPKATFNLNVFSKKIDSTALGLHKLLVRDEHIFVTRFYLLRKCAKKKCRMGMSFLVSDGQVFLTNHSHKNI